MAYADKRDRTLKYTDPAYFAHAEQIQELAEHAENLGVLQSSFRNAIFGSDGIVCETKDPTRKTSISRSYYGLAKQNRPNLRPLLYKVASVHASIAQYKITGVPVDYTEDVEALDALSGKLRMPSVLPSLLAANSVITFMKSADMRKPQTWEMWKHIYHMHAGDPNIVHAYVQCLFKANKKEEAVSVLKGFERLRKVNLAQNKRFPQLTNDYEMAMGRKAISPEAYTTACTATDSAEEIPQLWKRREGAEPVQEYKVDAEDVPDLIDADLFFIAILPNLNAATLADLLHKAPQILSSPRVQPILVKYLETMLTEKRFQDIRYLFSEAMALNTDPYKKILKQMLFQERDVLATPTEQPTAPVATEVQDTSVALTPKAAPTGWKGKLTNLYQRLRGGLR